MLELINAEFIEVESFDNGYVNTEDEAKKIEAKPNESIGDYIKRIESRTPQFGDITLTKND